MSKIQNAIIKFYKKNEKSIFTRRCFKYQKNTPKFVTIIFFMKNQRDFSVSKNGNEKIPKILQILFSIFVIENGYIIQIIIIVTTLFFHCQSRWKQHGNKKIPLF
jgi:hypothetical protein